MSAKIGNSAITWTPSTGTETERVHLLRTPLTALRPEFNQQVYTADSLDKTARETLVVGSGAHELRGVVPLDEDPQSLMDLIAEGSRGTNLVYYPDLNDPDVSYTCHLIAPLTPTGTALDPDRGIGFGEATVELVLRVTDESAFQPLYQGSDVLFAYHAGNDLAAGTYARSGTATYAAKGFGTLTDASTNKARTHWMSTASSQGPRLHPTLLLEPARTNLITESENFGNWTNSGSPVKTSGQTDPTSTGTNAYLLDDDSTVTAEFLYEEIPSTALSSTNAVVSIFLREGTTASTAGTRITFLSTVAVTKTEVQFDVVFSSGVPTVTWNLGSSFPVERWENGWYRIMGASTAAISSSKAHRMRIVPAVTAANKGNVYAFGAQVEQGT